MMEKKERLDAILAGLNESQREAVEFVNGPELIVAGAGSGKTKVLTSKVAYLLALGVEPQRVLALTFTKKAAEEMKERIALLVGRRSARGVVMGTFHSVFIRFLRDYAVSIGYPGNFTVYDRSDSESAVKACVKELKLDEKIYKPREVMARISFAKNGLFTPAAYKSKTEFIQQDERGKKQFLWKVYELYQQKLKENGVMDFDDILLNMNVLLRDNAEACEEISSRFDFILVDEYQDTNYAQYLILKKLSARHRKLCVVGDDSQSIYAFRGAQIQNILNFQKDYPECRLIRLEQNYRSTRNIVDAANSVIAHNEGRIPKTCYSRGELGEKIELIKSYTEQEEAVQIVSGIISRVMREKAQYSDFAVLYRTNSQSRALEEALRRKNIPYMVYSGNSFFDRAEIKDMMAWFKLAVNVNDDEAFKRAVGKPSRGIGDTSISGLNELRRARGVTSLFKAAECEDFFDFLRPAAMTKIREFCALVNRLAVAAATGDAFEVARQIYDESGLYAFFKSDTSIEGMARTSNLDELLNSVQAFKEERLEDILSDVEPDEETLSSIRITLADFLETTSLLSNADTEDKDENGTNKVALMTVHSAKGLEFPYVYIAGAEENLFPSGGMMASPADIEEERRLFYVALTRAKKAVGVSFASTRMRNGKHESNAPSRFVREIDAQYVANPLSDNDFDSDDDDDNEGMPFWFRQSSGSRFGGFSSRTTGPSRFGTGSFRNYGQSGPARSYPSAPAKGPDRVPQGEPGSGIGWPKAGAQKAPAMMTRVVNPVAKPDVIDPNFVPVPMKELYEGERVEHNRFGPGLIKEITGEFPELKAVIDFDNYGSKVLLLKYAKLRPEK
ncbi:MAG: UvrD-helicase domain-containing protein [Bacteroidales bacterium]|nr:UvrD-helicase domain-containing protein [Bacteroidales bacterium]